MTLPQRLDVNPAGRAPMRAEVPPVVPERLLHRGRPYTTSEPRRLPDFSVEAAMRRRCGEETGPWAVYVYPAWEGARNATMGTRYVLEELEARGFRPAP
jgi:hypothetical protein